MKRSMVFATMGFVVYVTLGVGMLSAQQPRRQRYRPYRPTVTRYLDYFRSYNDSPELGGALSLDGSPSYRGFVEPRESLRQDFRQQQQGLSRLSNRVDLRVKDVDERLRKLRKEMDESGSQGASRQVIRRSNASPTGTGSTFLNYGGYFGRSR